METFLQMVGLVLALVSAWLVIAAIRTVFRVLLWALQWIRWATHL